MARTIPAPIIKQTPLSPIIKQAVVKAVVSLTPSPLVIPDPHFIPTPKIKLEIEFRLTTSSTFGHKRV